MHQDGNGAGGGTMAHDPDELAAEISRMQRKYLQGQKLLAGARKTDKGLRRRGHAPGPEFTAPQAVLEQELDALADRIRQARPGTRPWAPQAEATPSPQSMPSSSSSPSRRATPCSPCTARNRKK